MSDDMFDPEKFVLAMDVGTMNVRCHIYDKYANIRGEGHGVMKLQFPYHGWVELEPSVLWKTFIEVMKDGIQSAGVKPDQIACIGISTHRGTFTNWDRESGRPFHNFITWKDIRSESLCKMWNNSLKMKFLRRGAKFLHFITRRKRFLAASKLHFRSGMVVMRLLWILQHISKYLGMSLILCDLHATKLKERAVEGQAMFGTLDTWLLWKLTGGKVHVTDSSCASISGMYDPFQVLMILLSHHHADNRQMRWASWLINMLNIPPSLLPVVKDTSCCLGETSPTLFGTSIPITAIVGDQQASAFGECCFRIGDIKCTVGTGAFMNVNTGYKPRTSLKGFYPVVGWKIGDEVTYLAEGSAYDAGTVVFWGQKIGLYDDVSQTSDLAKSVLDSDGVYFVPAFSELQAPVNDSLAGYSFIGLTNRSTRAHMARALLESLAFRIKQMYEAILEGANFQLNYLRIDGGVSNNDFLVQLVADLTEHPVNRPKQRDMSCLGAAFLAGLAVGVWNSLEELEHLRYEDRVFSPCENWKNEYKEVILNWERAVHRCLSWYKEKM